VAQSRQVLRQGGSVIELIEHQRVTTARIRLDPESSALRTEGQSGDPRCVTLHAGDRGVRRGARGQRTLAAIELL
jgi:hypothetical protein